MPTARADHAAHSAERRVIHSAGGELDSRADRRVAELAAEQSGVVSVRELCGCGLSLREIEWRAQTGWLHRVHRGVYAVGHANLSLAGRFRAAAKACGPSAALSHYAAAAEWRMVEWDDRRWR